MKNLVESYLHACEITGEEPLERDPNASPKKKAFEALWMYETGVAAQNKLDDFVPNLADENQIRYEPWYLIKRHKSLPSGFGLSYYGFVNTYSFAYVGVRLELGSVASAKYIGNHPEFLSLYDEWNH